MARAYVLSFTEDVSVDHPAPDQIIIETTDRRFTLSNLRAGLVRAIQALSSRGATEDELAGQVEETDGADTLAIFFYHLATFARRGMLRYGVYQEGEPLAVLAPASPHFVFAPRPCRPEARYILSRFSYLHREAERLVMESPLSHGKVTLYGRTGAGVAALLAEGRTPVALRERLPDLPPDSVRLLLEMLLAAGFVHECEPGGDWSGESETLAQWEFHDLLFHARSRLGRHANPFGGTYRFQGKIAPLPAVKPPASGAAGAIELYRPDMDRLEREDHPFSLVLEERKSIREYADTPITDLQLGEFLYRAARVKEQFGTELHDLSRRPYPGGGAVYELEIYAAVGACANIPPGLYHYCPAAHRLEEVSGPTEAIDTLLKDAMSATGQAGPPQVLLAITARFQRFAWKYQSMAYNAILKNVGVLYQTMYLVATAMDLAPCALGGGDSDHFARAAGLDYYAETSVGEFLLGSKRI